MKKTFFASVLVILLALLIAGIVYACGGRPPEPVCPAGYDTITPAVWVNETSTCPTREFTASHIVTDVAAHTEYRFKQYRWSAWSAWSDTRNCEYRYYKCEERTIPAVTHTETFGPIVVQYTSSQNHCNRPTGQSLSVPSWAMSAFNGLPNHLDFIVVAGYWIDPVCQIIPPYVPCSVTVPGTASETEYGNWSECVDDSQSRSVTTWSVPLLDSVDGRVCTESEPTVTEQAQPCDMPLIPGCMNSDASNYNELATIDDGSCVFPPQDIPGCMDEAALNFNPDATIDDGSCEYATIEIPRCQSRIWIWDIEGPDGRWHHLRDRGYDGSYDAPGLAIQRYYFGCDFYPVRVWGHWVNECDPDYNYWDTLARFCGGGNCPLP